MSAPLTRVFQSAEAVVTHVPEYFNEAARARVIDTAREPIYTDWGGFARAENTPEAWNARVSGELLNGSDEFRKGLDQARKSIVGSLHAPLNTRLKATGGHTVGHSPNISRAMRGIPGAFNRWERCAKPSAVTIYVNGCVHGGVSAKDLVWRGVAALALADLYEAAGYRVEIWQATRLNHWEIDKASKTFVLAKGADQSAIPDHLATIVMSPRFWRGVLHQRIASEHGSSLSTGVGDVTAADIADAGLPEATVTVPGNCLSAQAAIELINKTISTFGA